MRVITLATTAALMACIALPAAAAAKKFYPWTPTFGVCDSLAFKRGVPEGERRSSESGPSSYRQFMVACLAGKVSGLADAPPKVAPGPMVAGKWDTCEAKSIQLGQPIQERRSEDSKQFIQFMRTCMAARS
jgi:hypothetical protein